MEIRVCGTEKGYKQVFSIKIYFCCICYAISYLHIYVSNSRAIIPVKHTDIQEILIKLEANLIAMELFVNGLFKKKFLM